PACRTLDCVSVLALTAGDAHIVLEVLQGFDRDDPFSRAAPEVSPAIGSQFKFGVPRATELEFYGDGEAQRLYFAALKRFEELGGERVEIDFRPFLEAARLLYEGPWVAERWLVVRELLARNPQAVHPITRSVIENGARPSAADTFAAQYRLQALRREAETVWDGIDVLATPTAPTVYTIAVVEADPLRLNSRLRTYTHFVKLLDLCGTALPPGL